MDQRSLSLRIPSTECALFCITFKKFHVPLPKVLAILSFTNGFCNQSWDMTVTHRALNLRELLEPSPRSRLKGLGTAGTQAPTGFASCPQLSRSPSGCCCEVIDSQRAPQLQGGLPVCPALSHVITACQHPCWVLIPVVPITGTVNDVGKLHHPRVIVCLHNFTL